MARLPREAAVGLEVPKSVRARKPEAEPKEQGTPRVRPHPGLWWWRTRGPDSLSGGESPSRPQRAPRIFSVRTIVCPQTGGMFLSWGPGTKEQGYGGTG